MTQRTLPFADGMALGLGINDLTGEVGTLRAVEFSPAAPAEGDEGMGAHYDTSLVYSSEQLYSALSVDVSAEGRYGLFSAEGKFKFAEESRFSTSSTFLVTRAEITNAFLRAQEPKPVPDAATLVSDGNQSLFRQRYGDLFIRGVQSGGEYIAILSITSKTEDKQRELGLSLKASFDGIVASGALAVSLQERVSQLRQECEIRTSTYQRGGSGEAISFTGTIDAVMERLKTFATAVKTAPKAYAVQAASYDTLVFPNPPSPFDIQRQQEVLADCMKKRLQLQTIRNDLEMVLQHSDYFASPPDLGTVSRWSAAVTDTLNQLDDHVHRVVNSVSSAKFFALTLPDGLLIPTRLQHTTDQVEIFTHSEFGAGPGSHVTPRSQKLTPGWYDVAHGQISVGSDQISSIKVPEGLAVRAYEHAWFQGAMIDFTVDTPNLAADWNDRISSLVVYNVAEGPPKVPHIVVIDDASDQLARWMVLAPGKYPDLASLDIGADRIGALLIPQGMFVGLWDAAEYQGESVQYSGDVLALPPEWDNRAGSIEVLQR